jgi:hypothetical protein
MLPHSFKIISYFLFNSHKSLNIALGLRNNDALKLGQFKNKNRSTGCESQTSANAAELIRYGETVIKGLNELVKIKSTPAASNKIDLHTEIKNKANNSKFEFNQNVASNGVKSKTHDFDYSTSTNQRLKKLNDFNSLNKKVKFETPKKQKLSEKSRESKVPSSRVARVASFGG